MQRRRKACRNLIYSRIKQELLICMCQKSNNRTVNFHILNGKNRQRSTILPEKMSTRFPPHYLIREILTEIGAPKRIFFSEIWFMMHEVNCGLKCGHLKTLLCTRTYFQMVNYLIKPLGIHDGSLSPFFFFFQMIHISYKLALVMSPWQIYALYYFWAADSSMTNFRTQ
jgi:hypothetical protein